LAVVDDISNGQLSKLAGEVFDATINPLAGMICTLLQVLIDRESISKDDAKSIIASAVDLINESGHDAYIFKNGHDMLLRMIKAIDRI
jgi:hypothetical protein